MATITEATRSLSRIRERAHTPLKSALTTTAMTNELVENLLETIAALTKENAALKERMIASEAAAEAAAKAQEAALLGLADLIKTEATALSERVNVIEKKMDTVASNLETLTKNYNAHKHQVGYDHYTNVPTFR